MKNYTNSTGAIVGTILLLGLMYGCASAGDKAIAAEFAKYNVQRKERVYSSLDQYEQFIKENTVERVQPTLTGE